MGLAMIDGRLVALADAQVPATDLGFTHGWTVFETLRVLDGQIPLLELHLERLAASAAAAEITVPAVLRDEIRALAGRTRGEHRLRATLSGSGLRVLTVEPVPPERRGAGLRCVRGLQIPDPYLPGSVKHGSRAAWMVAVRRSGVDEVLLVDAQGRFAEGTTCGILAVVGGVIRTAPHDGRILASTTVTSLLERAEADGVRVVREAPSAAGPWDGLYVASATRGLCPVIELDGVPLPGWEPVGRRVAALGAG